MATAKPCYSKMFSANHALLEIEYNEPKISLTKKKLIFLLYFQTLNVKFVAKL